MTRQFVSKEQVETVAEQLLVTNKLPTISAIREQLGYGSRTTINKFLASWKKQKISGDLDLQQQLVNLQQTKQNLELQLQQLEQQQELNANELLKSMQKTHELENLVTEQQSSINLLEQQKCQTSAENVKLQAVLNERQKFIEMFCADKQQEIDALKQELKTMQQAYMSELRELGASSHEQLMQQKVINMNLEEQVKRLTNELRQIGLAKLRQ